LEAERIEEQKRQEEERVRNAKEQAALLAKAFLSEFTPQLVRQILELLCDESVSDQLLIYLIIIVFIK